MGTEYEKDTTELTSDYYDFSAINRTLSNVQSDAEDFRTAASNPQGNNGVFSLVVSVFNGVGAFFSIGFSMFGFIVAAFDFIIVGTLAIIFANPILTGSVSAILIILALFGLFRWLKIGS